MPLQLLHHSNPEFEDEQEMAVKRADTTEAHAGLIAIYLISYSPGLNCDVIFQYSTSRHGVIANTRPRLLRYQLVMPLWVHTMR
jgi:hypothetical protein